MIRSRDHGRSDQSLVTKQADGSWIPDKSLIFTNHELNLEARLKANLKMLDELQLNITTARYCENGNDFESIIDKLETPNFLGLFQSIGGTTFD